MGQRIKDLLLCIGIAIALVLGGTLYAYHQAKFGAPAQLPSKPLGLFIMTGLLLYFALRTYRTFPNRSRFWGLLTAFFAAHFLVAYIVLVRVPRVTLGDFAIATIPEYLILMAYLQHFTSSAK